MILVVGGKGNMGNRYCRILDAYEISYQVLDTHNLDQAKELIDSCTKMIVASPTGLHEQYIEKALERDINVLCEKPISKNLNWLRSIASHENISRLRMVNNYYYAYKKALHREGINRDSHEGKQMRLNRLRGEQMADTTYNYHHSGQDGIGWDCIQLIMLATGRVHFRNKSVVWGAAINGIALHLEDVLSGYRSMIIEFITDTFPRQDILDLIDAHQMAKWVTELHETAKSGNSDTSETKQFTPAV